ncbi:cytochrome P450 [Wenjunlia tyrosinilytica]|uniref:Cytochrome P450 n=1 Tax=Wenjunlia tyrosinilytica TaxID=1544741 RepID=A0A917ZUU4_9ACTN|nr:cytochrome P450 [Wenjunlia tyrosinilytica]GGO93382.1 cytochrome P450 [Wenjunlia tyrosinilytica]
MIDPPSIPTAPGSRPLLGHGGALLRDPLRFLSSLPEIGDLVRVNVGPFEWIAVCDPDLMLHVFRDDRTFDKGGLLFDRIKEVTGPRALAVMEHADHRTRRRIVQPAFHPSQFTAYSQVITQQVSAVMDSWRDGQYLDLFSEMKLITARAGLLTMFSYMQPDLVLSQALDDTIVVMDSLFRRTVAPTLLNNMPLPANIRYNRANQRIRDLVDRIIHEYRSHGVNCGDLMSVLLNLGDADSSAPGADEGISNADIYDEVTVFFLAVMETTAALLSWTLTEVAQRRHIHERLRQEVDDVLAGKPPELKDLPDLKFTVQTLQESLRLHPPVWMLTRNVTADTELLGRKIAAGSTIMLSPYILHQRADIFPDPGRFNPDRWLKESVTKRPRNALLPFGHGARKCIGDVFGMTEAALVLASIISGWDLVPHPTHRGRASISFVLSPRRSLVRITARRTHGR